MPIKWTPENDQLLLLKIIETHAIKIDPNMVVKAWPTDKGNTPTARAISERLVKIRQLAAKSGNVSANISVGSSASKSKGGCPLRITGVTSRKLSSSTPVTPKNKGTSGGKKTPASKKRKVKESSDEDDFNDEHIGGSARVSRREVQELNDSPSAGRGSQSATSTHTTITTPRTAGAIKRQAADENLHGQYQSRDHVLGDAQQNNSQGQDLTGTVMGSDATADAEPILNHTAYTGYGSMYDYPAIGTQTLQSDNLAAYNALYSEPANEGILEGSYGGNYDVDHHGEVVCDGSSSIQHTTVHLHCQPPVPMASSTAHSMSQPSGAAEAEDYFNHSAHANNGIDRAYNGGEDMSGAEASASLITSCPRTRRAISRGVTEYVKNEGEEFSSDDGSIAESNISKYTDEEYASSDSETVKVEASDE